MKQSRIWKNKPMRRTIENQETYERQPEKRKSTQREKWDEKRPERKSDQNMNEKQMNQSRVIFIRHKPAWGKRTPPSRCQIVVSHTKFDRSCNSLSDDRSSTRVRCTWVKLCILLSRFFRSALPK